MVEIVPKWLVLEEILLLQTRKMRDTRSDLCKVGRLVAQRRRVLSCSCAGCFEGRLVPGNSWMSRSMWWGDLGWQLSPTQPLTHFFPQQDGIGRTKVRKPGCSCRQFNRWSKAPCVRRQMSSHFLKCMDSASVAVTWEGKHPSITPKVFLLPFILLSPSFYCWAWCYVVQISLWSIWVSCPGWFSSQSLAHSQHTHCEGRVGKKPWCCANTVQQLLKRWCVISTRQS